MNRHLNVSNGILNLKNIMKKQIIEQIGRQKNPMNESFDKIYAAFDKKDYFGVQNSVDNQVKQWERMMKRGDKEAKKWTPEKLEKIVRDREKERSRVWTYERLKTAIKKKDIDYLKSVLRHDQKFTQLLFMDITGKKLPKTTRDIHKFLDDMFSKNESVNESVENDVEKIILKAFKHQRDGELEYDEIEDAVLMMTKGDGSSEKRAMIKKVVNNMFRKHTLMKYLSNRKHKNNFYRIEESINEAKTKEENTNEPAKDFAKRIEKTIKNYFPKSSLVVRYEKSMAEGIYINFAIGKGSDWASGYKENSPITFTAWIWDIEDAHTVEKMVYKPSYGGALIYIQPVKDKYLAYERVKVPSRKVTGGTDKIIKAIDKLFSNLKVSAKKNLSGMKPEDKKWVKKYL